MTDSITSTVIECVRLINSPNGNPRYGVRLELTKWLLFKTEPDAAWVYEISWDNLVGHYVTVEVDGNALKNIEILD